MLTRRALLQLTLATAATRWVGAQPGAKATKMNTRAIPRTGEQLPCIGMGTWQTFDVSGTPPALADVITKLLDGGARVIDSSPMYGKAEQATGDLLAKTGKTGVPFLATKVWTSGKREGIDQMARSFQRMGADGSKVKIDLMQVHNLVDVHTHLPVLRDMKAAGKIRYLGVTHYSHAQFGEIEKLMKSEKLDFIQIPYSITDREVEKRILPAAKDTGTAVLVMTPFESGGLFAQIRNKPLPAIARELDCSSWAQLFLKFLLGHPAVTCPIPATSKVEHLVDNLGAGTGRYPDESQRNALVKLLVA